MDITEIIRRWQSGKSIRAIKAETGYDRQTIGKYISLGISKGISKDVKLSSDEINALFSSELNNNRNKSEKNILLEKYLEEFKQLVTQKNNPLKPKSAFEVITENNNLTSKVSYTSFKRFAKAYGITKQPKDTTCRIEIPPASQIQVDYARMGYMLDSSTRKRKTVYAFIGTLGYSRHKFIEYVHSQNQKSFVQSHVNMFQYFGGLSQTIRLDNLKSGVIKPDLYDPQLNRAYSEMAAYYGIFIDPCRVATPKDKPIVERDVQTVREEFRKMLAKTPGITLSEANREIKNWAVSKYGNHKHGTTQQKPYESFIDEEKPALLPLPLEPFEAAEWKEAKVHPDHYIQVNNKSYSIPHAFVGKNVWVKVTHNLVYVYYDDQLIKQHVIPNHYRQTDMNDFPDNMKHALDTGMPLFLINKAAAISAEFGKLITKILSPNAYINMRRAQSIIGIASGYSAELIGSASAAALDCYGSVHPKLFKSIIEKLQLQEIENDSSIRISENTLILVRSMDYFTNN